MLVGAVAGGACGDQEVVAVDQQPAVVRGLAHKRPDDDITGRQPVEGVEAAEQRQDAAFFPGDAGVARVGVESSIEGRVLFLRMGRQIGVHPVHAGDRIVHDMELILRAGQRMKLPESVVDG